MPSTIMPDKAGEWDDDDGTVQYLEPGQRRPRPLKAWQPHKPKREPWEVLKSLVEPGDPALRRNSIRLSPTLDATSEEQGWIVEHLNVFAASKTLSAVLRRVKGGKEANVYCCAAHPDTGLDLIAAKLYRARMLRNLRNDSRYRLGRPVLSACRQGIDARDLRLHKTMSTQSTTGLEATQASLVPAHSRSL